MISSRRISPFLTNQPGHSRCLPKQRCAFGWEIAVKHLKHRADRGFTPPVESVLSIPSIHQACCKMGPTRMKNSRAVDINWCTRLFERTRECRPCQHAHWLFSACSCKEAYPRNEPACHWTHTWGGMQFDGQGGLVLHDDDTVGRARTVALPVF